MSDRYVQTLIREEQIHARVSALAGQIHGDYAGRELTVVPVLTGALPFAADFIRHVGSLSMHIEPVVVRSYRGTDPADDVQIHAESLDASRICGRHVLLLDDILDTGRTLTLLTRRLLAQRPESLRAVVLLRKRGRQQPQYAVRPDYVGFDIPDRFVVGYGMDFEGRYRNLNFIGTLREDARNPSPEAHGARTV